MSIARTKLSILVCAFNMERELPRTLFTLSSQYQRNIDNIDLDITVLDNGSRIPLNENALQSVIPGVRVIRPETTYQSPISAINEILKTLTGDLIGLLIDGARMCSPGLLREACNAWQADRTKAIGTLAFHLGPDVQMRSVSDGYNQDSEDKLLSTVEWQKDGYKLFDISVLAGSSASGWFGTIGETNALFMDQQLWQEVSWLDERFEAPGGGLANLDLWSRAVKASRHRPWMILGEATFHQFHGGAATNGTGQDRKLMRDEYERILGEPYKRPDYTPQFVGSLSFNTFSKGHPKATDKLRVAHAVRGRKFNIDLPTETLQKIQQGTLKTKYKGLRLAKNPFDLALYSKVIESLRPASIIEIGTSEGGSAVWLLDQCKAHNLFDTEIFTIDIKPPELQVSKVNTFYGDSEQPAQTFPTDILKSLPHPWLVIEDSAHTYSSVLSTLRYFDSYSISGDIFVIEDGCVADLVGKVYQQLNDGPNKAVREFLKSTGTRYTIESHLCDFYGYNVTYAPNAWLIRN